MSVSSISQSRTSPRPNPAVLHPPQYRAQHQPHLHHQTQYQQGYGHNQEFPPEFTPDHRGNGMAFNNPPRGPPPKWAEQVQSSSDDSAPEADDNNPWESGTSLLKELTEASAAGNSENLVSRRSTMSIPKPPLGLWSSCTFMSSRPLPRLTRDNISLFHSDPPSLSLEAFPVSKQC